MEHVKQDFQIKTTDSSTSVCKFKAYFTLQYKRGVSILKAMMKHDKCLLLDSAFCCMYACVRACLCGNRKYMKLGESKGF
jgi:hypothetical protein